MPGVGDVRRWQPMGLDSAAAQLQVKERALLELSDELDATAQPREWVGAAADAAYQARGQLTERIRRVVTQVQAAATATRAAGDAALAVRQSLQETEQLAATYYFTVGDDGAVYDAMPPEGLITEEAFLADRVRMLGELQARVASVLRSATEVDADLTRVLTGAANDTLDDGTGTTLAGAAFAGVTAGQDQTPLPPPVGGSPAANKAYWDALTAPQHAAILAQHPEWVGNTDGIPATVRDQANRAQLPGELAQAQANLQPAADARARLGTGTSTDFANDLALSARYEEMLARRDSLLAVQEVLGKDPPRQLLTLDTSGEMVKAAVAVGDVDTADHVSVHVPGMTTTVDGNMTGKDQEALELQRLTQQQLIAAGRGDETVAAVSWIGYEAPQWAEFNDDQDLSDTVATDDTARQAAPGLASFLNGLDAARVDDPHLTTNAHSYGTTTTGYALQQGTGVDDAVFYGSPGLGTDDVADLGVPQGHVFVEEATGDPVADFGSFGGDPNQMDGATILSTDGGTSPDGVDRGGSEGHSEYNKDQTMAQYNQAVVVAGMPDRTVAADDNGSWGDAIREYAGSFVPRWPF